MPSEKEHLRQYESNNKVLSYLSSSVNPPYDWIVTIMFYNAVHLIESKLAGYDYHTENHKDRNKLIKKFFKNIQVSYETLYIESRNARYNCVEITPGKAKVASSHLKVIEQQILSS